MALLENIIDGTSAKETADGYEFTRVAIVSGVSGSASAKMHTALTTAGVPVINDAHPDIDNCFLESRDAQPDDSPSVVRITLNYKERKGLDQPVGTIGGTAVTVGTSLASIETNQDTLGNPLRVYYTDANGIVHSPVSTISVDTPLSTLVFQRRESSSPGARSRQYAGKCNSNPWQEGDTNTWKCTSITGTRRDDGVTYDVTYEFVYNADGWKQKVVYQDPATGKPPSDLYTNASAPNSEKSFYIYLMVDFNALNLT